MDDSGTASNVARAIVAALDWGSPPDARKAAVSYLDSIKSGDVRVLANTSVLLVKKIGLLKYGCMHTRCSSIWSA